MAFQFIHEYMVERYRIFIAKERKLPKPWTQDTILQQYKFTNVKRKDDRTTRELMGHLYTPNFRAPPEQVLLNATIARYFGTWEFAVALGWQRTFREEHIRKLARARLDAREPVFTGAYVITNQGIKDKKENVVTGIFLKGVWEARKAIIAAYEKEHRWEHAASALREVPGFGGTGFMAKEVLQDCMLTSWMIGAVDADTWSPCGPGARRGLNRIYARPVDKPLKDAQALEEMQAIRRGVLSHWPEDFPQLTLHDIQFALCEWDKYNRVALGEGRPRSKYPGV